MKKYLKLILVCLSCVFLAACGDSSDEETETAEIVAEAESLEDDAEEILEVEEEMETSDENEEAEEVKEVEDVEAVPTTDEKEEEQSTEEVDVIEKMVPQEEVAEPVEAALTYTYTDLNQTMYAKQTVNVRDLPDQNGTKVGGLSTAQEVTVTGQCNETSWYRISYNGTEAYVSNNYLLTEKPVVQETTTQTAADTSTAAVSSGSDSSGSQSSGASVTVPDHEETGANLVWVPTKGGKKYHSKPGCSNMEDPMQVTVETAIANGYDACKRCH